MKKIYAFLKLFTPLLFLILFSDCKGFLKEQPTVNVTVFYDANYPNPGGQVWLAAQNYYISVYSDQSAAAKDDDQSALHISSTDGSGHGKLESKKSVGATVYIVARSKDNIYKSNNCNSTITSCKLKKSSKGNDVTIYCCHN